MEEIVIKLDDKNHGSIYIMDGEEELGEMVISIKENILTAHHTAVDEKIEGKGFGKKLFAAMVDHARKNNLKVMPLCNYVHAQFKRNESEYGDLWEASRT